MNRILFAALLSGVSTVALAADAALETAPVMVPQVSGYAEFYAGGIAIDLDMSGDDGDLSDSDSATSAGGAARVNIPFDERWNLQLDGSIDHISADGSDITGYGAAAHLFWRDPNSFAVGGFVGVQEMDQDESEATTWTVGPEAQFYLDNLTLYGQVFYSQMDISGDIDFYGVRAVARYFVQPNLRFDVELGFRTASESDSVASMDIDVFTAALQASYRFDSSPWTLFGRYQFDRATMDITGPFTQELTTDSHKFVAGIRASFGTGTLFEEDRYGATMDTGRANFMGF